MVPWVDVWQVGGFLRVLRFPSPIKLTAQYDWNIIESGIKRHTPIQIGWCATGLSFSVATPVSSTNKTDSHEISEIFLKVALNNIHWTL